MKKWFDNISKTRFGWTLAALTFTTLFIAGMLVWQLYEVRPGLYCALADQATEGHNNACLAILLKVIEVKDHNLIGLMTILGFTVLSILAVALGLNISGKGPGGTSVNINRDTTRVENEDVDLTIPTPPSEEK